ncbi:MAG: ArnT family glycosyltransferase [bacterium]
MRERIVCVLGILGLWAVLYLPGLGRIEMEHEEGRRALAAREMLQSGSWIHATVLQETYLNKPPGFSWLILLASSLTRRVNEWSVRFPSALATLATALLVCSFAPEVWSARARFLAAALFLLTFLTSEKGRQGEIDAAFVLFVWASLRAAWCSRGPGARGAGWCISGLWLGGAFLLKGPPALLFYYGTLLPFHYYGNRCRPWLLSRVQIWIGLGFAAVVAVWLVPLLAILGWQPLWETLVREIGQRGASSHVFFKDHAGFIISLAGGMLPGVLWLPAYFGRHRWKDAHSRNQEARTFLLCLLTAPLLFFLYFPGARARYMYPAAPAVACLAAWAWDRARDDLRDPFLRIPHAIFAWSAIAGGGAAAIWAGWVAWNRPSHMIFFGLMGSSACLLTAWLGARFRDRFRFSAAVAQILALACLVLVSVQARVVKQESMHEWRDAARRIMDAVPPGSPLYTLPWDYFGLFYYVEQPVIHIQDLSGLPPGAGDYFVVYGANAGRSSWKQVEVTGFEPVPLPKGSMIWIIHLRKNPG